MSEPAKLVAAGWYQDPDAPELVRWWNGIAWTDHTDAKPADGLPDAPPPPGASATLASRLLAFSPLLFAATSLLALGLTIYMGAPVLTWAILVVPFGLCVLWGLQDAVALRAAGLPAPARLWTALGPLVHLVARRVRVAGSGPLLTHLLVLIATAAVPLALAATGASAPFELAHRIQSEIHADLVGSGQAERITCPPVIERIATGAMFSCDATLSDGSTREVIVSIDSDEGAFSYSFR